MQFGGQIRQPGAKRTLRGCLLGPAGAVLLALAVVPPAAFATSWANGSEAVLPANASSFQGVNLSSVSCGSAGNCSAVGDYVDSSNNRQGLLLNEVNGVWQAGIEPTLPANALSGYSGAPDSVSCPSAGNCTAVGDYTDTGREGQGLLLTETNGTWATGQEASLPAGAIPITVILSSVSCASVGNCTAVGEYTDTNRAGQGVLLTETNGVWATGVKAPLPANASTTQPGVQLWSVSCASAGNCTAVGFYYDTAGNRQGVLLTETGGTWGTGEEAVLPAGAAANPFVILTAVSCGSAGDCSAVGEYQTKSGTGGGLLLTQSGGVWASGITPTPPGNGQPDSGSVGAVSCSSAGNCTAVGNYLDTGTGAQGLLLTETAGTWGIGSEAPLPANANSDPAVRLTSVSCVSADNCSAVGTYYDDTPSGPGYNTEPLLLTETGGVWTASQAVLPPNATSAPLAGAFVVSCAAADDCSAIGAYHDASNNEHGLLLGGSGAPLTLGVTLAGAGQGQVTGSGIACPGTCSGQYPAGTTVTLTATSASGSTFTGWSGGGCSGTGPCAVTLNEDEAVTATFVVGTRYSLKLSKSGSGTGTVTSSPAGIRCGASCSAHFVPGTQVTLIPTPASGSDFVGWSGCPGTSNAKTSAEKPKAGGPPSACRITMNSSHALVANFVSKTQVASATKGLKGDLAALHQALTSPSAVGTAECKGKVSYNAGAKQAEQYQASPITVTAPPGTMPVANEGSTYATTSRPIVVFTGARHRFLHSGTATITQRLTRQGRQLLKQAARQHRTLTLSFRMSSIFADPVQVDTGGQIKVQPPAQPHC